MDQWQYGVGEYSKQAHVCLFSILVRLPLIGLP